MTMAHVGGVMMAVTLPHRPFCQPQARLGTSPAIRSCIRGREAAFTLSRRRSPATAAALKTEESQDASKSETGSSQGGGGGDEEEKDRFGLFDWSIYAQKWDVPWSWKVALGGAFSWALVFAGTGIIIAPLASDLLGFGPIYAMVEDKSMGVTDAAGYAVFNQVLETALGVGVIYAFTAKFRPFADPDLFRLSLSRPLAKKDGWLTWAGLGYITALVAVGIVSTGLDAGGWEAANGDSRGTVDEVASIITSDVGPFLALLSVTSLMAPLLEEYVFRGFLLTSFQKWMPTPLAVVLSAGAFAGAHLSVRDFPQLFTLGIILGFSYVRTRNLVTPMVIHSTWNSAVLLLLTVLVSSGVDIEQLLHGGDPEEAIRAAQSVQTALIHASLFNP